MMVSGFLRRLWSDASGLLRVPTPPPDYLERRKHSVEIPWYERWLGVSPWRGKRRGFFQKMILSLVVLGVAVSLAGVFYSRRMWAEERSFQAGVAAIQARDFMRAQAMLKRAIEFDPSNAAAYFELGNAALMLGESAEAMRWWTEALQRDPRMDVAYIARGIESFKNRDFASSLQDFDRAVAVRPSMQGYLQRGLALQALGQHDAALRSLDEAAKLSHSPARAIQDARAASVRALENLER